MAHPCHRRQRRLAELADTDAGWSSLLRHADHGGMLPRAAGSAGDESIDQPSYFQLVRVEVVGVRP